MKLLKSQKVPSSLSDSNAELSVMGVFQVVEDAITEFMGDLKIDGITAKKVYNAIWVYSKTKIKFLKNIGWNQEYKVCCGISKVSNVTMDIDVGIKNTRDELCYYAKTELCALDMASGRIRKVSSVGVDESMKSEALSDISFTKIDAKDLPVEEEIKVRFTNIDYASHTNNKEYVRFMLNTYSVAELNESSIREMEIVFANQSYENDVLTIRKGSCCNKDIFAIQKDGADIVKCEIIRGRKNQ